MRARAGQALPTLPLTLPDAPPPAPVLGVTAAQGAEECKGVAP